MASRTEESFPTAGDEASSPLVTLVVWPSSGITGGCISSASAKLQNEEISEMRTKINYQRK